MRRILLILAIVMVPAVPIVLVVTGVLKKAPTQITPVTLTIWGTEDQSSAFAPLIAKYKATHPYATITYQKVSADDYAQHLLQGWSQGNGPDIFFTPNTWVGGMANYAVPMPADLTVPVIQTTKGLFGVTQQAVTQHVAAPSTAAIVSAYVDAVGTDIVRDGQVWALPLSMDTIVLYYNKDLLNNAKIFEPASTWPELATQIQNNHLTVTDADGHLVRSGVALGTANNVPYASDLLQLLMMQNGATMVSAEQRAAFNQSAGLTALNFYTSFAQSQKTTFSWDGNQTNALDAFTQGKVAYYFGTLADRTKIEASGINWSVSQMLHLSSQGDNDAASGSTRYIDVARYPVLMVSKASSSSGRATQAWSFLQFASQSANVPDYLDVTGGLSAQKSLLTKQKDDPKFAIYAGQLLTARTWYHGTAGSSLDQYFKDLITSVVSGRSSAQEALNLAADQINSTL